MINIHVYQAKTELGKMMSNMANAPIQIEDHGWFRSIEAYWYWLQHNEETLRYLHGAEAKRVGREVLLEYGVTGLNKKSEEFVQCICHAVKVKIANHPELLKMFCENTEKFEHKGLYGGAEIDMTGSCRWWLDCINGLITANRMSKGKIWDQYKYA